jgi:UDP:flavonoid glycosyltransferase YjiC (YdhE family)
VIALLAQCAYLSETSRMIEVYRALTARGATVQVATHGGVHRNLLTAAGIPHEVIGPPMSDERGARFVADALGLGNVRQSMYTDAELRAYVLAEAAWLKKHDARCVVTGFILTAQLSSRLAGIPLVTTHTGSWVPPVWENGLLPADPPWPAMRLIPEPLRRRLINAVPPRVRYYTAGFNRVADDLGVERIPSLAALVLGDLTLVTEIPEVLGIPAEDMAAWRGRRGYRPGTRLAYSGPLYAKLDLPIPPHVEEFLDRPGPIVYVALTSSSPELIRTVAAEAGKVARVLVAGTVHAIGDLHSGRTCVAGVLPSHLVMPRVDLAITTAGQGSVQTAMAAGTPLLAVPLQPEQTLNAVLVERLGAARRLTPAATTTAAALVRKMLDDDGLRLAAKRVKGWYDAVDGAGAAADRIIAAAGVRARRP